MRVLMIVGPATGMQGWGAPATTKALRAALESRGATVELLYVDNHTAFLSGVDNHRFDIIWSGLYFASSATTCVGDSLATPWIPDVLDERELPYVGSSAALLRLANNKYATCQRLADADIPVPAQILVPIGDNPGNPPLPAFVKPGFEAESAGISEASVVTSRAALEARVRYVHETFDQGALVEEFLPGRELTISVVGNGQDALIRPLVNTLRRDSYTDYPVLCDDVKYDDAIRFSIPDDHAWLRQLAQRVVKVLGSRDHTRIDAREDVNGCVKIIELNGNPGLDPRKSRAARIHAQYGDFEGVDGSYADLVDRILTAAVQRYELRKLVHPR